MTLSQWTDYVLTFVGVALAVYRMSVMLAMESGPFDVFDRFRRSLPRGGMLSKLFACPFCVSVYMAFAGAFVLPWYGIVWWIVTWLALSGVAVLLVKRFG